MGMESLIAERSDARAASQRKTFKNFTPNLVKFSKYFTGYNWQQSFLSFSLLPTKREQSVHLMETSRPLHKIILRASSATICLLLLLVAGDTALAQGRKGPLQRGRDGDGKRTVGILTKIFGKKKKTKDGKVEAADSSQRSEPRANGIKIEDTQQISADPSGDIQVDVPEAATQWAPDGRSFEDSAPPTGNLGLKDLIELALKNSDEVLNRENKIGIAEKRREAEKDWEDPELRFSVSRDNDVELRRPYKTTETRYIDSEGRDVTDSFERNQKGTTSRERQIRNEKNVTRERITKRVFPGIDGDRVEETVESRSLQSRKDSVSGSTTDAAGFSSSESSSGTESTRSTERETTRSFESNPWDPTHPDSGFRIRIRFPIPNFLERKQRIRQAAAEIGIAEVELDAARRQLIREVRDGYERIEYLIALDAFDRQLLAHAEDFHSTLVEQERKNKELIGQDASFEKFVDRVRPDEIAAVRGEIFELKAQLDENQRDIDKEKIRLAELARLGNPDRIIFTNSLVELDVDFGKMDIGYLKAMAQLKRPELKELRFELDIAESETAEEKSKRIPTINFFDIDYGQSFEFGERSKDEFSAQFGMSIPIWSLFGNKAIAASQQEVTARRREVERMIANIGSDVDRAVYSIQSARDYLLRTQESVARAEALLKQTVEEIEASAEDTGRLPEARFEELERVIAARQEVVKALRDYNQGVRALERTIGTDLESALGKQVK